MAEIQDVLDRLEKIDDKNDAAHEAITEKIVAVDKGLVAHLGEHKGVEKADKKTMGKWSKVSIAAAIVVGALGGVATIIGWVS